MASFRSPLAPVALLAAAVLLPASMQAQEKVSPSAAFREARALYYTPADSGLQGFRCEASFDWKQFIEEVNHAPMQDDDKRLQYLRSITLSVADDLHGTGSLEWSAPQPAPLGTKDSIAQIRFGMQAIWSGFFESLNGFYSGELVSLGDDKTTVDRTPTGYHVFTREPGKVAEETYTGDFTMESLHVSTPEIDSTMKPTFEKTPQGRLVTRLDSFVKKPPTAPGTAIHMAVHYALVSGFQLPSELLVEVPGTAAFDFRLSGCTVRTQLTSRRP